MSNKAQRFVIKNGRQKIAGAAAAGLALLVSATALAEAPADTQYWQSKDSDVQEAYVKEKLPPGFQVISAPLDGPIYADENGRTLYKWPLGALRNGSTGDRKGGPSQCTDEPRRYSAGLMSPYPAGLRLPDSEHRLSCAEEWPPVLAAADAEAVGEWTLVDRADGSKQWAYEGFALYFSSLDQKPGDVLGGTKIRSGGDGGVVRIPIGPKPDVPPEFKVIASSTGHLLTTAEEFSVYAWDGDVANQSNCEGDCLLEWTPVKAPQVAIDRGYWSVIDHPSGVKQWAFHGQPLYTYNNDTRLRSFSGSDIPNWHNVYTQRAVTPPAEFTVQDAAFGGQVLADANGQTIYLYNCRDDSLDQLACDHPASTQAYRLAICGNGDPERCVQTFPYVEAAADAESHSSLWTVINIDPLSGQFAADDQENAMSVWAYRGRPVYTFAGDDGAGFTRGDGFGEFTGRRNGFKAFVLRDNFQRNAFRR